MLHPLKRSLAKASILSMLLLTLFGYAVQARTLAYDVSYSYNGACWGYFESAFSAETSTSCYTSSPAAIPEPEPAPEPLTVPQSMRYQVNAGDTLYKIARTFDVNVEDLTAINAISDARALHIGQDLIIPGKIIDVNLPEGVSPVVSKVLMSTLTAYTAGVESTGKRPSDPGYGTTYSGSSATEGRTIAVDPGVIPIGARVFIDGIGVRTAEDIGSAIRGARIDVFMNDLRQAKEFGIKKDVLVYVLSA